MQENGGCHQMMSENGVPAKKEKPENEFAELLRFRLTQLQPDLSKTLDQKFESFEENRQEFNDPIIGLSKKLEEKLS